jgi:hypothetical protein
LTVVIPIGNVEPETGTHVTDTEPSTRSVAEALKFTTTPNELDVLTIMSAGKVKVGGVVSTTVSVTVTSKLPLAVFVCESVAEQLTVVVPTGNVEPDAGKQVTGTEPSTKSLAETVKFTAMPEASVVSTVIFAGKFKVGAVVSTAETLKLAVPVLPCVSVAEQLTVVVPNANVEPEVGKQAWVFTASSGSVAEVLYVTTAPAGPVASTLKSAGTVHSGDVLSTNVTVTVKLPFAVFLCASVAEQLTVVIPTGNVEPEAGTHVTATEPSTRSVAEAVKLTTVPDGFEVFVVISVGKVNTGAVVSTTVTSKLAVPILPFVSVAVQWTVVVPNANVEPEAGEQDCVLTVSSGSVTVAIYVATAPVGPVASTLKLAGTVHTGGVVSTT